MYSSIRFFVATAWIVLVACMQGCTVHSSTSGHSSSPVLGGDVTVVGVLIDESPRNEDESDLQRLLARAQSDIKEAAVPTLTVKTVRTGGNPNRALQGLRAMHAEGVRYVVGPSTSAEAAFLLPFAVENDMVLLSPSCTAPFLAIDDDSLLRLLPDDRHQAAFLAEKFRRKALTEVVVVHRDDLYGRGLSRALGQQLQDIETSFLVYPAHSPEQGFSYWPELASELLRRLSEGGHSPARAPGVLFVGFEELQGLFSTLNELQLPPKVSFFASEALTKEQSILTSGAAAGFLAREEVYFVSYDTLATLKLRSSGEPFGSLKFEKLATHDALWLVALAAVEHPIGHYGELLASVKSRAKDFEGLTGPIEFSAAGDRTDVSFEIWAVKESSPGVFRWEAVGQQQ